MLTLDPKPIQVCLAVICFKYYDELKLKGTEHMSILYGDRVTGMELGATQITGNNLLCT